MEKREALVLVGALVVILVVAVIFKPMLTGKQADLGIPFLSPQPTPTPVPTTLPPATATPSPAPTTIPTTLPPTWSGQPGSLGLANQTGYSSPQRPYPEKYVTVPAKMATYVSIQGQYGGTSDTFHMPYPYWEIHYTVNPLVSSPSGGIEPGTKDPSEGIVTASSRFPFFEIDVYDVKNPGQPLRRITPEGGLDTTLWKDENNKIITPVWVEKFYEGSGDYYFVITAQSLSGYAVMVKVPEKYIGT
jgi:hypothetical protein